MASATQKGRPRKQLARRGLLSIRVEEAEKAELTQLASSRGLSLSELGAEIVRAWLHAQRHDPAGTSGEGGAFGQVPV